MKTTQPIVLAPSIVLFVILLVAPDGAMGQLTRSPCHCDDVPNLVKLLIRNNVAIDRLEQLRQKVEPTDLFDDPMLNPNPTGVTKGDNIIRAVQAAVNTAAPKQAPDYNSTCVKAMEELRASFRNPAVKNADVLLLRTFIQTEKNTFAHVNEEIAQRIQAMDLCRPVNWFGTIIVREDRQEQTTERQPATDKQNLGGEKTQTDSYIRTGVIPFGLQDIDSPWQFVGTFVSTETHDSMHDCDTRAGAQFVNLVPYKTDRRGVTSKSGSESLKIEITPAEEDFGRKLLLTFPIPEIRITFDVSVSDTAVGGCPEEEYSRPESARGIPSTVSPISVPSWEATIVAGGPMDPKKVSGSGTFDLVPKGFSVPGTTLIHTVHYTYNLYQVKTGLLKPSKGKRRK
jgi:hypothetical protein